jgi:hypothetical protein
MPLFRHAASGAAPTPAASFFGFWGLCALFGSAVTFIAYFHAKRPAGRGPRGGQRLARVISIDASRRPVEVGLEGERRAA